MLQRWKPDLTRDKVPASLSAKDGTDIEYNVADIDAVLERIKAEKTPKPAPLNGKKDEPSTATEKKPTNAQNPAPLAANSTNPAPLTENPAREDAILHF